MRITKQFLKVNRKECCSPDLQEEFKSDLQEESMEDVAIRWPLCVINGQCMVKVNMIDEKGKMPLSAKNQLMRDWTRVSYKYYLQSQMYFAMTGKDWGSKQLDPQFKSPAQVAMENSGRIQKVNEMIHHITTEMESIKEKNDQILDQKSKTKREQAKRKEEYDVTKRKIYMVHRVMEILMHKFNEIRIKQRRIRFDRISQQLLGFFTHNQDVAERDESGKPRKIPRTVSFREIMRIYPNAETITFVNQHLDENDHNTSCLNELVIKSLLHEVRRERKEDENPKKCPLRKVAFTYYDYEGDIFEANEKLQADNGQKEKRYFVEDILKNKDNEQMKALNAAGWTFKHHKIGSGYKIRIERKL